MGKIALSLRNLVITILGSILLLGSPAALAKISDEITGVIDSVSYDASSNLIVANGWTWNKHINQSAQILKLSVDNKPYLTTNVSATAREDVENALNLETSKVGFELRSTPPEKLGFGTHIFRIQAIFSNGESVSIENITRITDKIFTRQIILFGVVVAIILLAYIPAATTSISFIGLWTENHTRLVSALIGLIFLVLVTAGITGSSRQVLMKGEQGSFSRDVTDIMNESEHIFSLRGVRSDEWGVSAPNTLAQINHTPPFPVINKNIGLDGQNMSVIGMTGVPIIQLAAFARPATWGYFFLPLRQAMSWQWQFPFFACLFFLWQTLNTIKPANSGFNLTLSAIFCIAPYAAAWSLWPLYAAFFPLAIFVCAAKLLKATNILTSGLLGLAIGFLLAGWLLVLYPPWQITIGWFILIVGIGWIADNSETLKFSNSQWIGLSLATLSAAILVASWWIDTSGAIGKMQATLYPGSRHELHGADMPNFWLLRGYTNPDVLISKTGPSTNQSEISSYLIFPVSILFLGALQFLRGRSGTWVARGCMIFLLFCLVFNFFGIPLWLAKWMLWSYVPAQRLDLSMALALFTLIAVIYSPCKLQVNSINQYSNPTTAIFLSVLASILVLTELQAIPENIFNADSITFESTLILGSIFATWWMLRGRMIWSIVLIFVLNLIPSIGFNPLGRAPTAVQLSAAARKFTSNHMAASNVPDRTLVIGGRGFAPMALAAVGVPVVNGIFYYPQKTLWNNLKISEDQWRLVNRYQHLGFSLSKIPMDAPFRIENPQSDVVNVVINANDFDFRETGAQRVVALEKDSGSLQKNPYLASIGRSGELRWFIVKQE